MRRVRRLEESYSGCLPPSPRLQRGKPLQRVCNRRVSQRLLRFARNDGPDTLFFATVSSSRYAYSVNTPLRFFLYASFWSIAASASILENFEGGKPLEALGWSAPQQVQGKADHLLVTEAKNTFLRSRSLAGQEAKYLFKDFSWDTQATPWLQWRWRVNRFPKGARVAESKVSDAGAQIYVLWRIGRRNYVIKYFWSEDRVGTELNQGNILFGKLYGLVIRSGGPLNQWQTEIRNVGADFQKAFGLAVPKTTRGLAVLSDADETKSEAEADFDDFQSFESKPTIQK